MAFTRNQVNVTVTSLTLLTYPRGSYIKKLKSPSLFSAATKPIWAPP